MTGEKTKVNKYQTYTSALQKNLVEEFTYLYQLGFSTDIILNFLAANYFKSYSRVCQLVKPETLAKGLTQKLDLLQEYKIIKDAR